jgi:YD repeat-containing protein
VAELDGSGAVVSRFVYATHVNVPDYLVKGGQTYRLVLDHLGSVRLVVNTSDGTVAQRLDYDEYGRITQNTSPGFQPFGYAGAYDSSPCRPTGHSGRIRPVLPSPLSAAR